MVPRKDGAAQTIKLQLTGSRTLKGSEQKEYDVSTNKH